MASQKYRPMQRTTELVVRRSIDPKTQGQAIARYHRQKVAEAAAENKRILGATPRTETWVDGRKGAPLETVKLDGGVILTEFEALTSVVAFVRDMLRKHSPVGTGPGTDGHKPGRYKASHRLFVDGAEVDIDRTDLIGREYLFISTLPYARKIEGNKGRKPQSKQAPDGVYEGTAAVTRSRYSNLATVNFTFKAIDEGGAIQEYAAVGLGGRKGGKKASAAQRAAYNTHNENRFPAIVITLR